MKPLVIIPARGGSKGVPRKNVKLLNGRPLIQYTIDAARAVFSDDYICVSTEDREIISIVESLGLHVPFIRPAELATDQCGTTEVVLHALQFYDNTGYCPDTVVLLQATSPFRGAQEIQEALSLFDQDCDMVISVKETKANPYYVLMEEDSEGWLQRSKLGACTRRQDCPKVYEVNGAIYIIKRESLETSPMSSFNKVRKYLMSDSSSLDIDTSTDWIIAETMIGIKE